MSDDDETEFSDGGEGYADGDVLDIDWDEVRRLAQLQEQVKKLPLDDQPLANLGILVEMYGDDLEVI